MLRLLLAGPLGLLPAGALVSLCVWARGWFWFCDLVASFQMQFTIGLLGLGLVYLWMRQRWPAVLAFALAALAAVPVASWVLEARAVPPALRLVSFNVSAPFGDETAQVDWLAGTHADLILIVELTNRFETAMARLEGEYPHKFIAPGPGAFAMGLWSRRPLIRPRNYFPATEAIPAIITGLEMGGRNVTFIGVHPVPPSSPKWSRERNLYLSELESLVEGPVIMAGDFNAAPWSVPVAGLRDRLGLCVPPSLGTWPSHAPPGLRVAIDHVLLGGGLAAPALETGPANGSDHVPIIADIGWR